MKFFVFKYDANDYQKYYIKGKDSFSFSFRSDTYASCQISKGDSKTPELKDIGASPDVSWLESKLGAPFLPATTAYPRATKRLGRFIVSGYDSVTFHNGPAEELWISCFSQGDIQGLFSRQTSAQLLRTEEIEADPVYKVVLTDERKVEGSKFEITFTDGLAKTVSGKDLYDALKPLGLAE